MPPPPALAQVHRLWSAAVQPHVPLAPELDVHPPLQELSLHEPHSPEPPTTFFICSLERTALLKLEIIVLIFVKFKVLKLIYLRFANPLLVKGNLKFFF